MKVRFTGKLDINGARQYVSIRAEEENLPLLVYLHGGPGDAALPLVLKYNKELEKHFTVVVWEQRGAGKSYYRFGADEALTIDTFVQDTYSLITWALGEYRQSKAYLVGHSWGSVLGLRFCMKYPALVQTYIGCGQVVNMRKSCQIAYDFAVQHASWKAVKRLAGINCAYQGKRWLEDLLFVTGQVVRQGGSLYGARNYNKLVLDTVFSREYSIGDLIGRQKGGMQSIKYLWQELMDVSFEAVTSFEMPVVFVEGRQDFHVSSVLARRYFDSIRSVKAFHWFEHSCHFPQWSEAERFDRMLIDLL